MSQQLVGTLQFHTDPSGNLLATDPTTGQTYLIASAGPAAPAGIPEAPTDGQAYGRMSSGWEPTVNKAGDTMSGNLTISGWSQKLIVQYPDSSSFSTVQPNQVRVAGSGGAQNAVLSANSFEMNDSSAASDGIVKVNANSDITYTALAGPNNGQTYNLSTGMVNKTGDTMTGTLTINGTEGISTTGNVRLTGRNNILQIDTSISFVTITNSGSIAWNLGWNGKGNPYFGADSSTGGFIFSTGAPAVGLELNDGTIAGSIHWNASGDMVITQTSGPNAGKSVNLTSGKWA